VNRQESSVMPSPSKQVARILYVDTERLWRGGQEQLLGLMSGMQARGWGILLAAPAESPLAARAAATGIDIVPFQQRAELSPQALLRLLGVLRGNQVDILHFNTPTPIIVGGVAARLRKIPVVVASRRVNFPLKTRLSAVKYNLLLDRVFTVSVSILKTLVQGGVKPMLVETIYEGVDLDWIDSLTTDFRLPRKPGIVLGTVAHLSPEKGHRTLLEAARLLTERGLVFHLVLVGEGRLRPTLERIAKQFGLEDRVTFTGFRADSEALMRQFDVFCLPSLSEGLSSAILAAMASAQPVVSTRVGGIPELVREDETGYLVSPDAPEQLAAALARLIVDESLRRRLGRAGRKRVEAHFTLCNKLDESEAAYRRLLDERRVR
jgi:glycosyltransferase involved in cell wall biosynthesis